MKKIIIILIFSLFALPNFVIAQTVPTGGGTIPTGTPTQNYRTAIKIENPFNGASDLTTLAKKAMDLLMQIGGIIAVLMIMYAGFTYVTAGGSDAKIKKANEMLFYTLIGAAILLGAWVIVTAIQGTINQLR